MSDPIRIAMWSGPRNMSTTMMRSFGARTDTVCVDEPFYAPFLKLTGLAHPMAAEIFAHHESDARRVADAMAGPAPGNKALFYQKQMTHHMVAGIPRDWMASCQHAFLIRHPARVLASYARKMEQADLEAIGFPQQLELFHQAVALMGRTPVVVDSDDILADPPGILSRMCQQLGIVWQPEMLSWTAGEKPEDGAWAPHWYDAVWRSTGFGLPPGPLPQLDAGLAEICEAAMPIYRELAAYRIVPET